MRVRLITPVAQERYSEEELERRYEELVQHFIERETAFISWERLDEIEEVAAKLVEDGWTVAKWETLSIEQQAKLLGVDPTVVSWEDLERH
jgi:hypothetical protein